MTAEGEKLAAAACPHCGELNPAAARFCNSCGNRLADGAPAGEERKLVSILFVDLVGFTSLSERADPEDVRDALRVYYEEAKRRVEEHGGALEKFIGDALMAVFGAPVSHGDDAERAVRAGLAILDGPRRAEPGVRARAGGPGGGQHRRGRRRGRRAARAARRLRPATSSTPPRGCRPRRPPGG